MTARNLQLSYFAVDTPETWIDRMEAVCRILEETFPTEDLRVGSTMRRRWRLFGELEYGPVRFVRDRRRFFEQVLPTERRAFSLHSGDPNLGERCDRPIRFEGYEPRGTLDTIVQLAGSIGGGHAGLFWFSAFVPDCGWERIERLFAQLGDASGALTAHLSPRETEDRLSRVQYGAGSWMPIQPTEPESRLPKIVYCVYGGREAPEQPWFLGWLNYWSDATARFLGFPDPDRDAELLAHSYRTPTGSWIMKLGPDPLDHRIVAHVELLGRTYARFPRLGVRAFPRSP